MKYINSEVELGAASNKKISGHMCALTAVR
jgi:hypothetical protein